MTAKEAAQRIRSELKRHGWNARKVSVRCRNCTTDSALSVTILDASVPLAEVKRIAGAYECVDRDSASGEILLGGNLYVNVDFAPAALEPLTSELVPQLIALDPGDICEFRGVRIARGNRGDEWGPDYFRLLDSDGVGWRPIWGAEFTARQAAEAILAATE